MVEYPFEEAIGLLENNRVNAVSTMERLDKEISFLKDQITTLEVSILYTLLYNSLLAFI